MRTKPGTAALLFFCFLPIFPSPVSGDGAPGVSPGGSREVSAGGTVPPLRSFDALFPGLGGEEKGEALSGDGFVRSHEKNGTLEITPGRSSGIDLRSAVMRAEPSYLAESLLVVPYSGKVLSRADAYNALGKIRDLKGRLYHSFTRQADVPLFEDATRIESAAKNNPVPDPPPVRELPLSVSETVHIRLKDINFGNSYYRAEISSNPYGITCTLTNFKAITYLFLTVMKKEKFSAVLYLEPIAEGMLIYSVAGADASDFIASNIDIPSAVGKRLAVFTGWIRDGIETTG